MHPIARRKFLKKSAAAAAGVSALSLSGPAMTADTDTPTDMRSFLKSILYTKEEIDLWLAGKAFPFAKYHPEFGWLLNSDRYTDGIDGSECVYTYVGEDGERIMMNYGDKPCRINTYGNSFTQCHQVSDGETWQEVLAAHLQEPVRNFGIGGWSVYQAYLRMLKEEQRTPAEYIIFNIYDDDHRRNLDSWRNIRRRKHPRFIEPTLPYVTVDLQSGQITEHANPCPTRESVYKLCDLEQTYELFKDDFVAKIMIAHLNSKQPNPNQTYKEITELATTHGIDTAIENNATLARVADELHRKAALTASMRIVEKIEQFGRENNKKILFVLSFPAGSVAKTIEEGERWDQPFVDFMKSKNLPMVDLMEAHVREFNRYRLSPKEYLAKYYIGHYNPMGNLFCAFALKDQLTEMLQPKPVPYRN
ncbi:twin-arginine translocation signal domain-containing protein [candidate division KSB1 bacterium]|nr:twin-arginine translocation signal domain-containing protein [candidate division KSB1 bacterium]